MTIRTVRYWLKHLPIPEGWRIVSTMDDCHHGVYSVIIEKID